MNLVVKGPSEIKDVKFVHYEICNCFLHLKSLHSCAPVTVRCTARPLSISKNDYRSLFFSLIHFFYGYFRFWHLIV